MQKYDPNRPPVAKDWLSLDEGERIALVHDYHRRAKIRLPNAQLHAVIHAVVENQLALGETEVIDALRRLMSDGLDRHDAIHAIGQVFITTVHDGLNDPTATDLGPPYRQAVRALTAEKWRNEQVD